MPCAIARIFHFPFSIFHSPAFYLLSLISYLLSPICVGAATLENVGDRIGFGVGERTEKECTLTNATNTLRFFIGGRRFELNRRSIWLNAPVGGGFAFEYVDMANLIAPLFAEPVATNRPLRVQLDAGHGGEDSGCISPHSGLYEKDLVLDIALRAGEILQSRGMEVVYTRTNDTFVSLAGRSGIAAKRKAEAFVSVHANFAGTQSARGIETFTLPFAGMISTSSERGVATIARVGNANDRLNTILGYEIQRRMPGRLGEADRGLRHARFQVLRDTPCPAVLVEIGFLSNPTDSRNLSSNWYRDKIALAIADGVSAFAIRRPLPPPPKKKPAKDKEKRSESVKPNPATVISTNRPPAKAIATNLPPAEVSVTNLSAIDDPTIRRSDDSTTKTNSPSTKVAVTNSPSIKGAATNLPPAKATDTNHPPDNPTIRRFDDSTIKTNRPPDDSTIGRLDDPTIKTSRSPDHPTIRRLDDSTKKQETTNAVVLP